MAKKMYVGVQSYIQSTGSQYIKTNVYSRVGTKVVMTVSFDSIDTSSWTYIFGNNYTSRTTVYVGIYTNGKIALGHSGGAWYGGDVLVTNTQYKIEAYWGASSQYLKLNGTQVITRSDTLTDGQLDDWDYLALFHRIYSASTNLKMKLYDCKLYYNDNLVADYVPYGNGLYDNVSKTTISAGSGTFTQGSQTARQIKKLYVGVNNVAKSVKKVYVGVNNIARKVFSLPSDTTFSSSIVPTSWAGTSVSAGATFTASNTYGTWTTSCNRPAYSTSYTTKNVFDNSTSSYFRDSATNYTDVFTLQLPADINIKPSTLQIVIARFKGGTLVEGRIAGTSTWEEIYKNTSSSSSTTAQTFTPSVTPTNFYDQFRLSVYAYSSSTYPYIYEFKITSGTVRDSR